MYINCKHCNKLFYQNRKDKIFCSKKCVYKNLASINFNRRVHYNYLKLPDYINVLYGSVSAVKKEIFLNSYLESEGI